MKQNSLRNEFLSPNSIDEDSLNVVLKCEVEDEMDMTDDVIDPSTSMSSNNMTLEETNELANAEELEGNHLGKVLFKMFPFLMVF